MKQKIIQHSRLTLSLLFGEFVFFCVLFYIAASGFTLNKPFLVVIICIFICGVIFLRKALKEKLVLNEKEVSYFANGTREFFKTNKIQKLEVVDGRPYQLELFIEGREKPHTIVFDTLGKGLLEFPVWLREVKGPNFEIIGEENISFLKKSKWFMTPIFFILGVALAVVIMKYRVIPELDKLGSPKGDFPDYYGRDHEVKSNEARSNY